MTPKRLGLPVGVFLGLSAIIYLISQITVLGVSGGLLAQTASAILVPPLFVLYYRRPKASEQAYSKAEKLSVVLLAVGGLFGLVMIVRTPFVVFLQNPLEKTPLIYFLVLLTISVHKKPLSSYGMSAGNLRRQIPLGLFLLLVTQIVPVAIIIVAVLLRYNINLLAGYSLGAFALAIPFQVLAVGISEEGLFRGYFQTRLMNVTGIRRANLLQASLFGVWHFVWHINPLDLPGMAVHVGGSFVFGLMAGAYFRYVRSIAGLALFHGLSNSLEEGLNITASALPFSPDLLLAAFGVVSVVLIIALIVFAGRVSRALGVEKINPAKVSRGGDSPLITHH